MRALAPLVLILAALVGGAQCEDCPQGEPCDGVVEDLEPNRGPCENQRCVAATPGCDPGSIDKRPAPGGDLACATCTFDDVATEICGLVEGARCELRESAQGQPCRVCATDAGEVLYQDCFVTGSTLAVRCEPLVDARRGGSCTVCMAADGRVVETRCEPEHDDCQSVDADDGRVCRQCTRDGDVVILDCEQPKIEPRFCERYENQNGRCVDCYADANLLSHICTPPGEAAVSCVESITVEGIACQRCVDASGVLRSEVCGEAPLGLQCQELAFSDQSCVVCVDVDGRLASSSCRARDCARNDVCEAPLCAFEAGDGALCRVCGDERACVSASSLLCKTELGFVGPNGGGECTVCYDGPTFVEVYRDCNKSGPAVCASTTDADGAVCEQCRDPEDGTAQYSTCGGRVCYDVGSRQLRSRAGTVLRVDGALAVAHCGACRPADGTLFETSCVLRADCDSGENGIVDPDVVCPDSVVFTLLPQRCGNPWEVAGFQSAPGAVDELLAMMAFALETAELGVVSANHRGELDNTTCADDCACGRGDVLEVEVRGNQDAGRARELFGPILAPCQRYGCAPDGFCRADGACAY